jgi:transcription elongation factor GreA
MPEKPESFLTPDGVAQVKAELDELIQVKRPALALRLHDAIKMGDLSENADYHAAKEDQSFMEGRIQELENLLRTAIIIAAPDGSAAEVVEMGRTITVREKGDYTEETYTLVGAKEANPREGKISNESPIGKALRGKRVGDIAVAETPAGTVRFEILKIE